jgi:TRAP transporter TAXI family solute receptor
LKTHLLVCVFGLAAATGTGSALHAQPMGLGTSPQGSLTYGLGAAVSKVLQDTAQIQSRLQPQSGTSTLIPLVNSGEIDIGFANTAEVYDAFHGVGTFDRHFNPRLRMMAVLFPLKAGLFVRANSDIKSIKDMKGKSITYGLTSQEIVRKTVDAMLATGGLSISDLKPVMVPNVVRGADDLAAGRVDIAVFAMGSSKVAEVDAAVGIRFVPLDHTEAAEAGLKKEFPTGYLDRIEPSPSLAGVKEPIWSMHYDYAIFANADVPADRIKTVTRLIAENRDALASGQPSFQDMKTERLYNDISVPFHPGAIAYYGEKNIKPGK